MSDEELLRAERLAMVELMESLDDEEWEVPSLCEGWTVRAVAAHLAYASVESPLGTAVGMARAGFRLNRFIHDSAVRWARRDRARIVEQLRRNAETGARPWGLPPQAPLSDAVVHGLDVRVPLGRRRPVPAAAFLRLAGWHADPPWAMTLPFRGDVRARTAGVRLVCDDVPWEHGDGPAVHASSDTLLLLLTGRPVAAGDLTGPGAALVRARR